MRSLSTNPYSSTSPFSNDANLLIFVLLHFQINLDSFKKVLVSSKYNYIKDKVRGAGKYQDLLMMGNDNLAVPGRQGQDAE